MRNDREKTRWRVTTQSVYAFGREERLQSAYELALPSEKIELKRKENLNDATGENRTLCSGIK